VGVLNWLRPGVAAVHGGRGDRIRGDRNQIHQVQAAATIDGNSGFLLRPSIS
jgi:hypothetical protein